MKLKILHTAILAFLVMVTPHVQSQEVKGVVKDKITGEPLEGAHIKIDAGNVYTLSRNSGRYNYQAPKRKHQLTVTYLGYDTLRMEIDTKNPESKNVQILMEPTSILLEAGVINATSIPDTIFESELVSVLDFIFDRAALLILTYDKTPKKGTELWWVDENNRPISKYPVPGQAIELVYNYEKQVLLVCEEVVYHVQTTSDGLRLLEIPKTDYEKYLQPVISKVDETLFFSTFSEVYPAFKYMSYEQVDSTYDDLMTIEDTFMMELYRAEYRFSDVRTRLWAYNKQLETGIDKEVWVGATYFTQSIYYKELFAPLFKRNDTLVVFDHYSNNMFLFDIDRNPIDSIPLEYHKNAKKTGWQREMIQDEINGKIYTVFENAGHKHLKEVGLDDGTLKRGFKLHFKYVERIRIYNNEVYYVYRPFESIQKKYLYRERMK